MKIKNLTVFTAVLTLFVIMLIGNFTLFHIVTAQNADKNKNSINQIEFAKFSKSKNKSAQEIPDKVAYELFLRTVSEFNAQGLVERAGLSNDEVERIVSEAKSFNEILQTTDKRARKIKENQNNLTESEREKELSKEQAFKEFALTRTIERFLPNYLDETAMNKLQNFIYTEVKNNIQIVSIENISKQKSNNSPDNLQSKIPSNESSRSNIYLYNTAWENTGNVYGSGAVSESYPSEANYRTTITITSPGGRSNTAQSGWNNAIKLQSASIPIGLEDGQFNIQITFENQNGNGKDSSVIGYTTDSVIVGPTINVESVSPQPELVLGTIGSGTFTATVSITSSVPIGTIYVIEMYGTSIPAFTYSVTPVSRQQSFTVLAGEPGNPKTVSFDVDITQGDSTGTGTTVTNKFRVQSVAVPQGQPAVTAGTNQPIGTLKYIYSPTPTPTPTPSGGGGGNYVCDPYCQHGARPENDSLKAVTSWKGIINDITPDNVDHCCI